MYTITHFNSGRQVIEQRIMHAQKLNAVQKMIRRAFTQENMLAITATCSIAWLFVQYLTI